MGKGFEEGEKIEVADFPLAKIAKTEGRPYHYVGRMHATSTKKFATQK